MLQNFHRLPASIFKFSFPLFSFLITSGFLPASSVKSVLYFFYTYTRDSLPSILRQPHFSCSQSSLKVSLQLTVIQ